jgi:hypothetical protein
MPAAFIAFPTDQGRAHAHPAPDAETPLEAALLYVERWLPDTVEGTVSVTVLECETGRQDCFRIDLDDGSAAAC